MPAATSYERSPLLKRVAVLIVLALAGARAAVSGEAVRVLHALRRAESNPAGPLVPDGRGNLYGMTENGGAHGGGTVFTIRADGTGYGVLHDFAGGPADGWRPAGALVADGAGRLCGVTASGGSGDLGTFFRMREDGGGFEVLRSFGSLPSPRSLVFGDDGLLYGTTYGGLFRVAADGSGFAILHRFAGGPNDGRDPRGELVVQGGVIYGTTALGGQTVVAWPKYGYYFDGSGTVFSLRTDGSGFGILHRFFNEGPAGGLTSDGAGTRYGFTWGGLYRLARDGKGIEAVATLSAETGYPVGVPLLTKSGEIFAETGAGVLRMKADGTEAVVLHRSQAALDGSGSVGLLLGEDGSTLYRTMRVGGRANAGALSVVGTDGTGFNVIHTFDGYSSSGSYPNELTAAFGALYGTTGEGGPSDDGILYRIRPDGSGFSILHAFSGGPGDGARPEGALAADSRGRLYGIAGGGPQDGGIIFRILSDGSDFRILHAFERGGYLPSNLTAGLDRLYGVRPATFQQAAAIFSMDSDGNGFRILREFGSDPASGLYGEIPALASDSGGSVYGVAMGEIGGTAGCVFAMGGDGSDFRVVHSFTSGPSDGAGPWALVLAGPGVLVGTTRWGGDSGRGVLFRIGTNGSTYRVLRSLDDGDIGTGVVALVARNGGVWGQTALGGPYGSGTLFRISPDSSVRILRRFGSGSPDGPSPGSIWAAGEGELYGTSNARGFYESFEWTLFAVPDGLVRPAAGAAPGAVRRP